MTFTTFEAYTTCKQQSFSVEEMEEIFHGFSDSFSSFSEDETAVELYQDLMEKVERYAVDFRVPWFRDFDRDDRIKYDNQRTGAHNQVIRAFDILARYETGHGVLASWRERLGDNRKKIGDFACFLMYVYGICGR